MWSPLSTPSRTALPDRTAGRGNQDPRSGQPVSPTFGPAPRWTQANYDEIAFKVQEDLDSHLYHFQNVEPPEPDATIGRIQIHNKVVALSQQALFTPDPRLALNLSVLVWGMWQASFRIDDGKVESVHVSSRGPPDPDVNVEATRAAKFRILGAIEKELPGLNNKDFKNVLRYLGDSIYGMYGSFLGLRGSRDKEEDLQTESEAYME
ncbi:uncharacterized protein RCO7_02460 [Rhynchosporium graminicola]|uniref:Uncharacterized protein n=1 Tax=Rhynchosporium graminicola TaxID=2792576 RepID=A0A1E1JV00_9HELO|nr:uncharacterized protein RCO7_02460 [Rhynchosporium commune]